MTDISASLAKSPLARRGAGEGEYMGDGIPRTAGNQPFNPDTGAIISEAEAQQRASEGMTADELEAMYGEQDMPRGRRVELVNLGDVDVEPQQWLARPFIPVGTLTIYAGYGGVGKTLFALSQIAQLTTGNSNGDFAGTPVDVLYIGREDGLGPLKAHAMAAGIDLKRFLPIVVHDTVNGRDVERGFRLPDDLDELETYARCRDVKLVVIDPPEACIDGKLNDMRTVRRALDPLAAFAERCDVAVLLIGHMSTSGRLTGSEGFRDIVRSKVDFAKDPDAGDVVIELEKSQYSSQTGKCWSYRIDTVNVRNKFGDLQPEPYVNPVTFMETERTATELLARQLNRFKSERKSAAAECAEWLTDLLADGEMPAADVLRKGAEAGFSEKAIQNAKNRARNPRIIATPDPNHTGRGRSMLWKLDDTDQ